MAWVTRGTTLVITTPVICLLKDRPTWPRRPWMISASSSAVRSAAEEMRQCWSRRSRSNMPIVVCVFPTSTASSMGGVHLQAEVYGRRGVRQRADGDRVDPGRRDRPDRVEGDAAGRLGFGASL